ncbi:Uncharacterized protein dnm_025930 [Desulfonema magnum]|uniref:Uncharacterized protein n=1 Tax=Desulfonema magnum TaxID=45655 RepID=A0A975BIY8_9BACT|nr:Uncharacterized protein dnm_025930 [Desulfonema magnum]
MIPNSYETRSANFFEIIIRWLEIEFISYGCSVTNKGLRGFQTFSDILYTKIDLVR